MSTLKINRDYVKSNILSVANLHAFNGMVNCKFGDSKRLSVPVEALPHLVEVITHHKALRDDQVTPQGVLWALSNDAKQQHEFIIEQDSDGSFLNDLTQNYMSAQDAINDNFGYAIEERNGETRADILANAAERCTALEHRELLVLANTYDKRNDFIRALPYVRPLSRLDLVELLYKLETSEDSPWGTECKIIAMVLAGQAHAVSMDDVLAVVELWECIP